jgi:hypothetical protein
MKTRTTVIACVVGVLLVVMMLAMIRGAVAQAILPASKQAIDQRYASERAAGAQSPAPRDPNPSYPAVTNASLDRGIVDDTSGPFSSSQIRISNRWEGLVNGNETAIYAGGEPPDDDPDQGIVVTLTDLPTGPIARTELTNVRGGPVRIVAENNGVLTLVSARGSYVFTFDTNSGLFTSTAVDTTPPVISGMPAAGCTLWPPNHKLVQVAIVTATDALAGIAPGTLTVTGTSNEPVNASDPDIVIAPDGSGGFVVQLRAERLGPGSERVYALSAQATDQVGNTVTVTSTCTVPHDQGH